MLEIFPDTCIFFSVCLYGWSHSNVPLIHFTPHPLYPSSMVVCNIERLKGGTLEPWIPGGHKVEEGSDLKGGTSDSSSYYGLWILFVEAIGTVFKKFINCVFLYFPLTFKDSEIRYLKKYVEKYCRCDKACKFSAL